MKESWGKKLGLHGKEEEMENIQKVSIDLMRSNPYQPRKTFEDEKIVELSQSIKTYGLLQPIIITNDGTGFCIVAGERRLLACKALGWAEIPAIIREYSGSSMAAVALIENLQRENLDFMEEAYGYKRLIDEFDLTQEVLAQRLGKSQSTIANKLRLLKLPDDVKELLREGKLSERHARVLLKLDTLEKQQEAVNLMIELDMNVKEAEQLIQEIKKSGNTERVSNQRKVVIRDLRIFLNTIRHAISIIRKAGINPHVEENDLSDYWEIRIKLPKKENNMSATK
ncbi:MAG: nucleoid occlusion protein [Bacillota bacterium]|nr:nucleoid occlusion protein [Bacillota bacterium]